MPAGLLSKSKLRFFSKSKMQAFSFLFTLLFVFQAENSSSSDIYLGEKGNGESSSIVSQVDTD